MHNKKEYQKEWEAKNKDKRSILRKKYRKRMADYMKDIKTAKGCEQCSEIHISCLEFHHVNPESKDFTLGVKGTEVGISTLNKEIAKCVVLCCNCHRKMHWKMRQM